MLAETLQGPSVDWISLSPLLVLLGAAMVLQVVDALTPPWPKRLYALVTAGTGLMTLGDSRFQILPGDTVAITPGTAHCVRNVGDDTLVILCCCSPPYAHGDTELL